MTYHDPDPEMGLLGCILDATPDEAAQIVARVNPATFTHQTLVDAWAVIRDIEASGGAIDIVEIARRWPNVHAGQAAPVLELSNAQSSVPSPANWPRYAQDMAAFKDLPIPISLSGRIETRSMHFTTRLPRPVIVPAMRILLGIASTP